MSNKLVSITSASLLQRVKAELPGGAGGNDDQMFEPSSRAGGVSFDSTQVIKSADQTVDAMGYVTGADICLGVCVSSGL